MTSSVISRLVFTVCVITFMDRAVANRNGDLRLVSANTTKGWVEIYYNSGWNTISGRFIVYDISKVVCRQLGLPFTKAITVEDPYIKRSLDNIGVLSTTPFCDGDEARLEDCRHFSWSFSQYSTHDHDIAVHCSGEYLQTGDLRLVNGVDYRRGRLEIFMGNAWESICSVGFDVTEATVACRQLGLLNTSDVVVHHDAYFGRGNIGDGPYIVHCTGDEERIDSCTSFYRSFVSSNYDEMFCAHSQDVGICCPSDIGGCAVGSSAGHSVVGSIVGSIIVVVVVLLIIGCCCYCCCKKKKGKQQYTTVVQNPTPQPASGGQQAPAPTAGNTAPPVYYHGSTPGYPAVNIGQPNTQSYPIQYPPTGQAMPPPAPVAGNTPYPPQTNPYPTGQVPPPVAAGGTPYPSQPYPYPSGQVPPPAGAYPGHPQQPGYNPTAASDKYPATPYPPQAAPVGPAYGASSAQPIEHSYPTKGDVDHPLPSHTASETPSAPPMDMSSGLGEIPSAPPPAYEHLIG